MDKKIAVDIFLKVIDIFLKGAQVASQQAREKVKHR